MAPPKLPPAAATAEAADMLASTISGANVEGRQRGATPDDSGNIAQRIGRYALLRKLGEGGMGVVYAAYDEDLDRKVALKLLRDPGHVSAEQRTRVLREAQAMARISHPNVIGVYEVGEFDKQVFIAMEFVDGTTLAAWQRGGRTWEEVLRSYLLAGEGLAAAHHAGLIHRDFKPDNVLLGSDGRPRVADFGLVRSEGKSEPVVEPSSPSSPASPSPPETAPGDLLSSPLTIAGTVLGTPAYMSPEQHLGQPADSRSDQWSFCAALYEALYGMRPFAGDSVAALAFQVVYGKLRSPPRDTPVPPQIERVLRRGLSTDPATRYPSMTELLQALEIDPQHHPAGTPRVRQLAVAVMILVAVVPPLVASQKFRSGTLTVRQLFILRAAVLILAFGFAVLMRKSLLKNSFHRSMVTLLLILVAGTTGGNALEVFLGHALNVALAFDMLMIGTVLAVIAVKHLPYLWSVVGLCMVASAGAAVFPAQTVPLCPLAYAIVGLMLAILWTRAAARGSAGGR